MKFDKNIAALFALLRAGLWEDAGLPFTAYGLPESGDEVDWNKVLDLAEEQSVVGLIAAGIERFKVQYSWTSQTAKPSARFNVPKPIALQFIGRTVQMEQRNQAMNYFIGVMVEKMREAGIYMVLVKGQGVAQCYERPLWRSCGDVDFFLDDENYERAKGFLKPLAASVEEEYVREKHLGMTIDPWVVELHGMLYSGLSTRINRELDKVQCETFVDGNVRVWKDGGTDVPLLALENDVFYVFTHILQHFYKGGIGLRQICDWCRLLWKYRSGLDVAKLEGRLRRAGLMSEWKAFAALAVNDLGMPPEAMPMYDDAAKWSRKAELIKTFVMSVGNFGHNRDHSYFEKYPYLIRKSVSFGRRVGDLVRHAQIFPIDSLRFFPSMLVNGVRSVVNGEG